MEIVPGAVKKRDEGDLQCNTMKEICSEEAEGDLQ